MTMRLPRKALHPALRRLSGRGALSSMQFAVPSGLEFLPILPTGIVSPGIVNVSGDAATACLVHNAAFITPGTTQISPTGAGSDLTITEAVRTTLGPTDIRATAGRYDVSALLLRSNDTSQSGGAVLKRIRPADGVSKADVIFECPGINLATQTWASIGSGAYSTVLGGTVLPFKVTRTDQLDAYNYPKRFPRLADAAAVQAAARGWSWHLATRTVTIKETGSPDIEAMKAVLKGYCTLASGLSRILIQNAALLLQDITIEGINVLADSTAQAPAIFQPQLWIQNCDMLFAPTVGLQSNGAILVSDSGRYHAGESDCILHNSVDEAQVPWFEEINNYCTMPGDPDNGNNVLFNNNASSAHVGSGARLGGRYYDTRGPCIRDRADVDDATYLTWQVGVDCKRSMTDASDGVGHSFTVSGGSNQRREVWLDTCTSSEQPNFDLQSNAALGVGSSCEVHVSGGSLPLRAITGAGTVDNYSRSNP